MNHPILSFRDVSKVYDPGRGGGRHALRNFSIAVAEGSKVAISGRSGSGKSTFLHLAAGIDIPTGGTIRVLGQDLAVLPEHRRTLLRRDSIGLIFQFFHLLPHLSVRDNVILPELIAGERPGNRGGRADELLDRVGLADRACDSVLKLSGGEMQRVALCRALVRRPALLLADEPTGSLDDLNGRLVMDLLMKMVAEEGATLIYVTHSRELAAQADETWNLHSGILEHP